MKTLDLTKISAPEKIVWVALNPANNMIIGQAKTLDDVLIAAKKLKVSRPTVFKTGPFSSAFVG